MADPDKIDQILTQVIQTASSARLPAQLTNAVLARLPGDGPPPTTVPESWTSYDAVVQPAVDHFFRDVRRVLRTWTQDPIVLCCLIRNLAALGALDRLIVRGSTGTIRVLQQIRGLLDFMISILQRDLSVSLDESVDFLRFIMLSVIGAVITTLDILRKALQDRIFKLLAFNQDSVIKRCLPFDNLIQLILKVIQDPVNGILARFSVLLTDWTNRIRLEIHVKYNCGALQDAQAATSALTRQRDEAEAAKAQIAATQPGSPSLHTLSEQQARIQRSLEAVQQKVSLNQGMPLIGTRGCFVRKIEFLQQLRFYRDVVNAVIQGLETGILCAQVDLGELARTPDPLDRLGLDSPTPFPNDRRTALPQVYPTDDELRRFVKKEFGFGDPEIEAILGRPPGVGLGVTGDPTSGGTETGTTDADTGFLLEQIQTIETLADCTRVMSDSLIAELSATFGALERPPARREYG